MKEIDNIIGEPLEEKRVLYGSNPLEKKNPNSKSTFKKITKLVRLETGGKGRR